MPRFPHALVRASVAALLAGCSAESPSEPEILLVHLDDRPVLLGRVVERIDSPRTSDVYLQLALSDHPSSRRWVVLEASAAEVQVGQLIRVRSLAKRSHVWAAAIQRDFEVLEYVATIPDESSPRRWF